MKTTKNLYDKMLEALNNLGYRIVDTFQVIEDQSSRDKTVYELWYNSLWIESFRCSDPDTATAEFWRKHTQHTYDSKISQPIPVSIAIVKVHGRFVLGRRTNIEEAELYGFPGGKIHAGETPQTAVCRELKEETSLVAEETKYLGFVDSFIHRHFHCHVYTINQYSGILLNLEPQRCRGWELFNIEEVSKLPLAPTARLILQTGFLDQVERQY